MIEKIKSDVLSFFNRNEFHREFDRQYQIESYNLLDKLKVPYDKDFDLRNYSHYVGVVIDFDKNSLLLDAKSRVDLESTFDMIEKHDEITSVFISFSDIDRYLRVFGNRHLINDSGAVEVEYIHFNEIVSGIRLKLKEILDALIQEIGFTFLESHILEEEVNWLKETDEFKNIGFKPKIEDLVFGSFELYSELGL